MQRFQLIMNFLVMPLFFLSGALFLLQGLPKTLSLIASLDPLSYGIDAFRIFLIGAGNYNLWTDIGVLIAFTAVFLWLGSYLFKRIQI